MLCPEERRLRLLQIKRDEPAARVLRAVLERSDRKRAKILASVLRTVRREGRSAVQAEQPPLHALILKPVGDRCNLRCRYCFNRSEKKEPFTLMSKAVLERAVSAALAVGSDPVHFIWHGGEPLLAGVDFFQQAVAMQEKDNHSGRAVRNSVQTNGTLLNDQWIEFFRQNEFSISISLDGPEHCHNRHRRHPGGQGSYHQVLNSIRRLQTHQMNFGVLAVVTRNMEATPQEFFDFFVDQGIKGFQVSPCAWPTELAVSPEEYADFVAGVFDTWLNSDMPEMRVGPLENIAAALLGQPPALCWMAGTCSGFVRIEPDGKVWPCCDRTLPSGEYCWGNILEQDLPVMLRSPQAEKFRAAENKCRQTSCVDCQWSFACKGGCAHHRILHHGIDPFCSGYQSIFNSLADRMDEILS